MKKLLSLTIVATLFLTACGNVTFNRPPLSNELWLAQHQFTVTAQTTDWEDCGKFKKCAGDCKTWALTWVNLYGGDMKFVLKHGQSSLDVKHVVPVVGDWVYEPGIQWPIHKSDYERLYGTIIGDIEIDPSEPGKFKFKDGQMI